MPDLSHLDWPFFSEPHRAFGRELDAWAKAHVTPLVDHDNVDRSCKALVRALGEAGWLRAVAPAGYGGISQRLDVRMLCVAREVLAWHDSLADFAFAMQGLGTGSISLFGSEAIKSKYLPPVCQGARIAAFALSEPEAGSDVAALATTARADGARHVRLNGLKTWISNGGIADHYVVFARSGEAPGVKGLSAYVVDADTPGLEVLDRIDVIAPHPLGLLRLADCRVGSDALLGEPGQGFKIAMATLDVMRSTVGAAALGFARHAFSEAVQRARKRKMFGRTLIDMQITQARLGEMAVAIDASALLVYRAAWTRDVLGARVTREASMAKLHATEAAQQVIDAAVQIFGGLGVVRGMPVERLYREIRALRIYEGASEVLKLVVAERAIDALRERPRRAT